LGPESRERFGEETIALAQVVEPVALDDPYHDMLRTLSDRLVEAQRPIRVLDAIKWDDEVRAAFMASGGREQPRVDRAYYEARPLPFDADALLDEFVDLERDIVRNLGEYNQVGRIMRRMCVEFRMLVRMLSARGTPAFGELSTRLYGSAGDVFHAGEPTLADLGRMMSDTLDQIDESELVSAQARTITAEEAVAVMQHRLDAAFPDPVHPVRVILDDGIVADAAAGADYLKIRRNARFSPRDLDVLTVHEGWVHIGTTLNGASQPLCTFLSKGVPSSTVTQEGLAILMEVIALASFPSRLRRVTDRINAVHMAEEGATFLDVYRHFLERGRDEEESWNNAVRVFRGSTPTGPPFTKDLSYSKGFVLVYNFLQLAVRKGRLELIPLLFCGKTTLGDIPILAQLAEEGVVAPPRYLPPQIADPSALAAWMAYASFLRRLDLSRIENDYAALW